MANREVHFDFYRVQVTTAEGSPPATLADLIRTTWDNRQDLAAVEMRDAHYFLHFCEFHPTVITGNLLRVGLTEIGVKASVKEKLVEELDLAHDQGVGHETAFMYRPDTRLLCLQRSRIGVTRAAFAEYFNRSSNLVGFISLLPCIDADALARLGSMKTMRRFEIAVSPTDSNRFLEGEGFSSRALAEAAQFFDAPKVEIAVSMGKGGKKGLANVIDEVKKIFGVAQGNEIKRLVVTGKMKDGESDLVDLLRERITYDHTCPVDTKLRRVTFPSRRTAMHEAFKRRRKQLEKLTDE